MRIKDFVITLFQCHGMISGKQILLIELKKIMFKITFGWKQTSCLFTGHKGVKFRE